jgi:hypothetical protein
MLVGGADLAPGKRTVTQALRVMGLADRPGFGRYHLTDPTVANLIEQRYGNAVPLDEPVISPVSMFNSPLLVQVVAR